MNREDILYRILYSYFLEQTFSVATGRIDKLLSVACIILGLAVTGDFFPELSGALVVVLVSVQVAGGFRERSVNAMKKSAEYLQLFDDEEAYSDSDLKWRLKTLEVTDGNIWSSIKHIAMLKTQIRMDVPAEQRERLPLKSRVICLLVGD